MTETKRLQDEQRRYHDIQLELAHANRIATLGQLSASIAHELNQPLTGIITNCGTCLRMLTSDPLNLDGAREAVRRTMRDGNRASDVIARLRALFDKKEPASESVDLNEATREVIALSLGELQNGRVIVRTELADDLQCVTADRVQLQQVVLNLLRNAMDAMNTVDDRPRDLLIRTEREEGDWVRLSVKDAGVGFDPQTMDKLFEAFYSTKNDGMGVGLVSEPLHYREPPGAPVGGSKRWSGGDVFILCSVSDPCQRLMAAPSGSARKVVLEQLDAIVDRRATRSSATPTPERTISPSRRPSAPDSPPS